MNSSTPRYPLPVGFGRLARALCLAGCLSPLGAQAQTTQLWMDLSTSTFAGMPEFLQSGGGLLGNLLGGGKGAGLKTYGSASGRYIQQGQPPSGMGGAGLPPTRVIDVALLNPRRPGVEASLQIPPGLRMGEALPLVPPQPSTRELAEPEAPGQPPELKGRILIYWGCGAAVRSGQPRTLNLGGNPAQWGQMLAGRHAPERAARVGAQHALYPNEKNTVNPSAESSLVGEHQVLGEGVPESLRFTLGTQQDLMPAIQLQSKGTVAESIQVDWQPVALAHAYHLHAMGMVGDDMVLWSSSDVPDAGLGLFDYLNASTSARWVKDKLLLPASASQCALPQGIFANPKAQGGEPGAAMLRMIAFGPESHFSHPERPAKAPASWKPDWSVRVRAKSQTMAMLGVDMGGMGAGASGDSRPPSEAVRESVMPSPVNILKGLFGR